MVSKYYHYEVYKGDNWKIIEQVERKGICCPLKYTIFKDGKWIAECYGVSRMCRKVKVKELKAWLNKTD